MTEELINKIATINCSDIERKEIYYALKSKILLKPVRQRTSCGIKQGCCPSCGDYVDGLKNPLYCSNGKCLQLLDWN